MWKIFVACTFAAVAIIIAQETIPASVEQACMTYVQRASSTFKETTKFHVRKDTSVITSLELMERQSFHRCEPIKEKFGVDVDKRGWWVFKGCGGIFEIKECDSTLDITQAEESISVRKEGMMDFLPIEDVGKLTLDIAPTAGSDSVRIAGMMDFMPIEVTENNIL